GKSGYTFTAVESLGAGAVVPNQFLTTAAPLGVTTGTKSFCAVDDGVVRTQPAGTIAVVGAYLTCQGLNPLQN
ncbi:MAG: hypothetical protein WAL52_17455, partial [Candidatus Sulfotelmatobacter sp.]